jgi:3-oxoacyl-[acyl-carrier protein] reductase/meso-butanediol dehydrogenase/(S,S)-butanediol dehydrogenase/diacetyl reductase
MTLADLGADVVVTDIDATGRPNAELATRSDPTWDGIDAVAAEIVAMGRRSVAIAADITIETDVDTLFRQATDAVGAIDILVNNAAAPHGADRAMFWEVPAQAFDDVMSVGVRGLFLMSKAFARQAIERTASGSIINIASAAGKRGMQRRVVYCGSKAAVIRMTEAMALELAPHGVRVNAVCPGPIETDRLLDTLAQIAEGREPSDQAALITSTPLKRRGLPGDIANAVAFLASPEASFITGQAISVDGGSVLG